MTNAQSKTIILMQYRDGLLACGCDKCKNYPKCIGNACALLLPSPAPARRGRTQQRKGYIHRIFARFFALLLVASCVTSAIADVRCVWSGTWSCSGDGGGEIIVERPNLDWPTNNVPPVVDGTNDVGCVNNCTLNTPDEIRALKAYVASAVADILIDITSISNGVYAVRNELDYYLNGDEPPYPYEDASLSGRWVIASSTSVVSKDAITNYVFGVLRPYFEGHPVKLISTAWQSVLESRGLSIDGALTTGASALTTTARNCLILADIYHACYTSWLTMRDDMRPMVEYDLDEYIIVPANDIAVRTRSMSAMVDGLSDESCNCDSSGGGGGGGDDDDTPTTNPDTRPTNWCTVEQGEAIKDTLRQIQDYVDGLEQRLDNIRTQFADLDYAIRNGLYSTYTHIPLERDIGAEHWQQIYMRGNTTDWGYEPTNILQRIELLLYGISGVGTNDFDATDDFMSMDDYDSSRSDLNDNIDDFKGDITDALNNLKSKPQSLRNALQVLIRGFGQRGKDMSVSDVIIPASTFSVNGASVSVPAFALGDEQAVAQSNSFKSLCRNACRFLYYLGGIYAIWRFWCWFMSYFLRYSKWATELLNGVFGT